MQIFNLFLFLLLLQLEILLELPEHRYDLAAGLGHPQHLHNYREIY